MKASPGSSTSRALLILSLNSVVSNHKSVWKGNTAVELPFRIQAATKFIRHHSPMEIVSEGSLQPVSRPASCEKRGVRRVPTGSLFEQLPPEAKPPGSSLDLYESRDCYDDEDYGYDDDDYDVLISKVEGDVNVEDVDTEVYTIARQATSDEDLVTDEEEQGRYLSVEDNSAENRIVGESEDVEFSTPDVEQMDPKIRKGLEKIRKLDQMLSEKIQKEKEVKMKRRFLEKMWREQNQQIEKKREEEGYGNMNLGVAHTLALGPPDDSNEPGESDNDSSACVTPVFATQPLADEGIKEAGRSSKDLQTPSSGCSTDITDDQRSGKVHKKKKKKSQAKHKRDNFIKRNIALAADAGNVIPMTEEEKKRLEELLNEEVDQFVVDGPGEGSMSDMCVVSGTGFRPDEESVEALSIINHKLEALLPADELHMLSEQGIWTPISESEVHSQTTEADKRSFDSVDIGERVLREERDMRDMKQRLLAIEHELQSLENLSDDDLDVKLSTELLAKLIDESSRTTSRSTTISETVLSNLSTPRHYLHNAPLGEIEEASFDDDFSSLTSSRSFTVPAQDTMSNLLSLREYMDSPVEEEEDAQQHNN